MNWFADSLRWYLVTLVATIAFIPLTIKIFRRVPGYGAGFARPVAMLMTLWPVWFLCSVTRGAIPFSPIPLWISLVVLGATGWYFAWREHEIRPEVMFHFAVSELVHLGAFAGFLWLRGFGPQANWQEKPGDLMLLASTMKSTVTPPRDAWFAGHDVNYYYVGHAIWGAIGKMSGVPPAVAFNLALVSTFAAAFVAAAGLGAAILGHFYDDWTARIGGMLAAVFVLIIGNPWSASKAMSGLSEQWSQGFFGGSIGWDASRVIKDSTDKNYGLNPITEFPAFSFILGDLHPHLLALPFTITALGLAWMLVCLGRQDEQQSLIRRDWLRLFTAGLLTGALYAINSWDMPTYVVIGLMALGVGTVGIVWRERLEAVGIYLLGAVLPWLPFSLAFKAPTQPAEGGLAKAFEKIPVLGGVMASVTSYTGEKTSPQEFLSIFGYFYLIIAALMVVEAWRRQSDVLAARAERKNDSFTPDPVVRWLAIGAAVICFLMAILLPAPLLVVCGVPVVATWLLLERDPRLIPSNIAMVLASVALLLMMIPEFLMIQDIYHARMNTVFKVSYQAWLLLAIAAALAVVSMWKAVNRTMLGRVALPVAMALILAGGAVYPIVGAHQWLNWRSPNRAWSGVNGLAYLKDSGSAYAGEYDAITWLLDHAEADDVILAAGGGDWDYDIARVSSASGIPSVIGWTGHERQWHLGDSTFDPTASQRESDIVAMMSGAPSADLIDRYGITYIYAGPTEAHGSASAICQGAATPACGPFTGPASSNWPGNGWELVFDQGGSRIWHRSGS